MEAQDSRNQVMVRWMAIPGEMRAVEPCSPAPCGPAAATRAERSLERSPNEEVIRRAKERARGPQLSARLPRPTAIWTGASQ